MKPWVKTGLFFAIWMFVFMTFIAPYIFVLIGMQDEKEPKFPLAKIVINAVVFTIAGLYIGYRNSMKKKNPKKQINS